MTSPDPKKCPHKDLEFEGGGRKIVCRDCKQAYHAMAWIHGTCWEGSLDHGYHNGGILHKDRRTQAPALATPAPKK